MESVTAVAQELVNEVETAARRKLEEKGQNGQSAKQVSCNQCLLDVLNPCELFSKEQKRLRLCSPIIGCQSRDRGLDIDKFFPLLYFSGVDWKQLTFVGH